MVFIFIVIFPTFRAMALLVFFRSFMSNSEAHIKLRTRQYLNFNFRYPYNIKKGIVCCLQHWSNPLVVTVRHSKKKSIYKVIISIAPTTQRAWHRLQEIWIERQRTLPENSPQLVSTVSKASTNGFKRYVVHIISEQYLWMARLFENMSSKSNPKQNTNWQRIASATSHAIMLKSTQAWHATH